jgi:hypothetical protein
MTDDTADTDVHGQHASPGEAPSPYGPLTGPPQAPSDDDPLAALERLQSLGPSGSAEHADEHRPRALRARGAGLRGRSERLRLAAALGAERSVARIAAPVVFLVAVIAFISIVMSSGITGDEPGSAPTQSPTPKATRTKSATQPTRAAANTYVIKSGDTLSGIAAKFDVTVGALEELNPDLSASTLVVGDKIKIPVQ